MVEFVEARSEFVMVNEALPYITLVNAFLILYVRSMQVSILEMYMVKNIFLCVISKQVSILEMYRSFFCLWLRSQVGLRGWMLHKYTKKIFLRAVHNCGKSNYNIKQPKGYIKHTNVEFSQTRGH